MVKLKDRIFRDYTIKIDRVRDIYKQSNGIVNYVDKMFLIGITDSAGASISWGMKASKHYGNDLRKILKEIKERLYLNQ